MKKIKTILYKLGLYKIKTREQAKELGVSAYFHLNGAGTYEDEEGFSHLLIDKIELTKGIKTKRVYYYCNKDGKYQDEEGFGHFFRNGVELTKGIKAIGVSSYDNGDWEYKDEQGFFYLFRKGIELTKNVKAKYTWSYNNGDWEYKDEEGKKHEFDKNNMKNKNKKLLKELVDYCEKHPDQRFGQALTNFVREQTGYQYILLSKNMTDYEINIDGLKDPYSGE